jgi:carbonic anhydrase/acetyltransferase-like protein (isoleucine patch superfamily)
MTASRPIDVRNGPLLLPYEGIWPGLATPPNPCAQGVSLLGKLQIGPGATFGWSAVVRGDGHHVRIGEGFHMGAQSTIHISEGNYPTLVGDRVSVGRDTLVHACTVGDDCVIEDGVVILDGSVIEDGVVIESGSVVFPRSTLKGGLVYAGVPAKPVRPVEPGEIERRAAALRQADRDFAIPPFSARPVELTCGEGVFVAGNARLSGVVRLADRSSVFFGCRLDAGSHSIDIAEATNIQDNVRIDAHEGPVTIGAYTTVGHNAQIHSSRIGQRCLVGMGADLAPGTVAEDDVLIAAGARTEPGQRLESGWIWGGRPAKPIAAFDEPKRAGLRKGVDQYLVYAEGYARCSQSP